MSAHYSEAEVIALIPGLTQSRLADCLRAEVIHPVAQPEGWAFDQITVARLALVVDLTAQFDLDLDGDALALVLSLIDQLHAAQRDTAALAAALSTEPEDVRRRIGMVVLARRAAADTPPET